MGDRNAVVARIRAEHAGLEAATFAAVQGTVPVYRMLDAEQVRDVSAITAWVLSRLIESWRSDSDLDPHDLNRFRGIGAARAEEGRPLPAVLRAYRVAAIAATDAVLDLGADQLDRDDVRALTRIVLTATDQLSEAIIAGYTAARDRLTGDRDRALRDLLDDLLTGRHSSPAAFTARSRELDVEMPDQMLLVILEPTGPTRVDPTALITALTEAHAPRHDVTSHLVTSRGRRWILLLPHVSEPQLELFARARTLRGCAVPALHSGAVPDAHRLAADALDTAPDHAFADRAVLDEGDARLLSLLAARSGADPARVAATVLGPLVEPAQRHLFDGLAAYLTTGNAIDAARALHLHPQTLRYRLRRARELTGRDPRHPWHRLALDVARQALCAGTSTIQHEGRHG